MKQHERTPGDGNQLLTAAELAELAGVSLATIRRLIWSGQLPAVRVGRLVRIRLGDWHAYLGQHRAQASSPLAAMQVHAAVACGG